MQFARIAFRIDTSKINVIGFISLSIDKHRYSQLVWALNVIDFTDFKNSHPSKKLKNCIFGGIILTVDVLNAAFVVITWSSFLSINFFVGIFSLAVYIYLLWLSCQKIAPSSETFASSMHRKFHVRINLLSRPCLTKY